MFVATQEPKTSESTRVADAVRIIQEHLDKEARNRRQTNLSPRELCPMQKAELVQDLVNALR